MAKTLKGFLGAELADLCLRPLILCCVPLTPLGMVLGGIIADMFFNLITVVSVMAARSETRCWESFLQFCLALPSDGLEPRFFQLSTRNRASESGGAWFNVMVGELRVSDVGLTLGKVGGWLRSELAAFARRLWLPDDPGYSMAQAQAGAQA